MDKVVGDFSYEGVDAIPIEEDTREWKVYFDNNFWGQPKGARAGTEIRFDREFDWAGYHWVIPAVYACEKGLVMEFCRRVEVEDIRDFMKKWNLSAENDSCAHISQEQRMQLDLDNPLCLHFNPRVELNGETMQMTHGSGVCFNPCVPEGLLHEPEAERALKHYGLDLSYGWTVYRYAFPWANETKIKTLSLTMEQQACDVPGPHFKLHAPGDSFSFVHPMNGTEYTLTVQALEPQTMEQELPGSEQWLYPMHLTAMCYTIFPEQGKDISIYDCAESDKPIKIAQNTEPFAPEAQNGMVYFGTVVCETDDAEKGLHTIYSSLHFEPVTDDVEWCVIFHLKQFEEESFLLI